MNIRFFNEILTHIEEIKIIGKSTKVDDVICNVMGVVRHGMEIRLLILQYDHNFQQKIEESEATELIDTPSKLESNRSMMRSDRRIDAINPFQSVSKVFIGERKFEVDFSEHQRLSTQDWEKLMIIAKFLNHGWQPKEIDYQNIDMLFLTSLKLVGDYISIPNFDQNPELRFVVGPHHVVHQVEKPITLDIAGDYTDKIMFQDETTGAQYWVQINRVYLADMWEEIDNSFTNPKVIEQMTPEELNQTRTELEKKFMEICPRGMYYPVIEYECNEDISLQFYSKSYLDAKPLSRSSGIGFTVRPDQPTGSLGLKLKVDIIQEPVLPNTKSIEIELFQYTQITTRDDIQL